MTGGLRPEPVPAANLPEAEPSAADRRLCQMRGAGPARAIPVLAAAGEDDESDNDDELTAPPVTRNLAEESGNTRAAEVLTGPGPLPGICAGIHHRAPGGSQ